MNENEFATGSVPVMVAARIYGKDASWVRAGIISGWFEKRYLVNWIELSRRLRMMLSIRR